jgi:ornithine lipid hydroxylase
MKRFASQVLLLAMIAAMALAVFALWDNPNRDIAVSVAAITVILFSLILERLWPHDRTWNTHSGHELTGDVGSFVLVFALLDGMLKWLTPFAILSILPTESGSSLPLLQETVVVVLWIELAAWASHWAHHHFPSLWALHAMHHSTNKLYTLNNFRFHPLNHILNHISMIVPLAIAGISADAMLIYTALSLPVLLLQHSNVDFDFGVLNRVLNTNDLHRWHHSTKPEEGTKNLGRALIIWDRMFGTYLRPTSADAPEQIGLFASHKSYPVAARFWEQILWPFRSACCR